MSEQRNITMEMLEEDAARLWEELSGVDNISEEDRQEEEEQLEIERQQAEEEEEYEPEGVLENESLYIFNENDYVIIKEGAMTTYWPDGEVLEIVEGITTDNNTDVVRVTFIDSSYGTDFIRYLMVCDIEHASPDQVEFYIKNKNIEAEKELIKIKEVVKSNEKTLLEIKKSLTEIFEDNWDIQEDFDDYKYNMSLILRFPEVTIRNGRRGKRVLYDLFVRLKFNEKLVLTESMHGRRGAVTYSEYKTGYRHSHLPSSSSHTEAISNICNWKQFCLGSSEIAAIQRDWKIDRDSSVGEAFDIIQFELFMYQIQAYVSWESLGGGPHIRMENVTRHEGITTIRAYDLERSYRFVNFLRSFKTSFDKDKNKFIVDKEDLETQLTKLQVGTLIQKTGDGKYIYNDQESSTNVINNIEAENKKLLDSESTFNNYLFRGKAFPTYILDYEKTEEEISSAKKVVHPDITNYFASKLEASINHYFIKKYGK